MLILFFYINDVHDVVRDEFDRCLSLSDKIGITREVRIKHERQM